MSKSDGNTIYVYGLDKALRTLRDATNLSQQKVAQELGISLTTYGKWEKKRLATEPLRMYRLYLDRFTKSYTELIGEAPKVRVRSSVRAPRAVLGVR